MKLLKLRLSNLNALYGEWSIDFEHRAYVTNGLFAITGPTGAGKSTLLDAISLALYGRTPRLGVITNSTNEIMSRDCGECFAEVTFQSSKGTFCAHWSQRRARSKGDGNLQTPQHELTDVATRRVLTAKKNETLAIIQDNVGLDYEQFMRSIMLAQGDFANFLKSEDSNRAAILAKITGTDIYARIGKAVFQRHRSEADALRSIASQSSAIELLSAESIAGFEAKIRKIETTLDELNNSRKTTDAAVRWIERLDQLNKEVVRLDDECKKVAMAVEVARPLRQRLDIARRASGLRRSLDSYKNHRTRILDNEKVLAISKNELVEAEKNKATSYERLEKSKVEIDELTASIESSRPLWFATHDLDLQIDNLKAIVAKTAEQGDAIAAKRKAHEEARTDLDAKCEFTKTKLAQLRIFQTEHGHDAEIASQLPVIEHLGVEYLETLKLEHNLESELTSISNKVAATVLDELEAKEQLSIAKKTVTEQQTAIREIEARRRALMEGQSTEALQSEYETLIASKNVLVEHVRLLGLILEKEIEQTEKSEALLNFRNAAFELQKIKATLEKHIDQQTQLVTAHEGLVQKDQLIASFQKHRARLVAGQPCELCGSTEHPWSEKATTPAIGQAEQGLIHAKEVLIQYVAQRDDAVRDYDRHEHNRSQLEVHLIASADLLRTVRMEWSSHVARHNLDANISVADLESSRRSIETLQGREETLNTRQRDANSLLETMAQLQSELASQLTYESKAEQHVQSIANVQLGCEESIRRVTNELEQHRNTVASKQAELTSIFDRLRIPWSEDLPFALQDMRSRSAVWQTSERDVLQYENALVHSDGSLASLALIAEQSNRDWHACQSSLKLQSDELETLVGRRMQLFGDKDPQKVESDLREKLQSRISDSDKLTAEVEPLVAAWQALVRQVLRIESSLSSDKQQASQQQSLLVIDLQSVGFVDIPDLESAIQSESDIEEWSCQLRSLDEALRDAATRTSQKETERNDWRLENRSDASMEVLRQKLKDIEGRIEELQIERVQLQHRISDNEAKSEQWQEAQIRIVSLQKQVQRWSELNELIGSADGAKFRKFAQGITFELLLAYANVQLKKLTDRYLLRKGAEGLSLVVIDHYQSSRSRSAANLSGGESFLVSLSLALGLSKLASQNVQIDSLFLDEGFGTLDEETLEEALHTLSNLRQEGKLVGLISHVPALQQQIPVRIEVVKGPLGRSQLRGPGVEGKRS